MDIWRGLTRWLRPLGPYRLEPAASRLNRVGLRLAVTILAISALLPLLGLLAEREQRAASLRDARVEARDLAQVIAYDAAGVDPADRLYQHPAELQRYLDHLWRQIGIDAAVIDSSRRVLATTMPSGQADLVAADGDGQVGATIRDATMRDVVGQGPGYPGRVMLVVAPLRTPEQATVGVVVIDYTDKYAELLAQGAGVRRVLVGAGIAGMAVALGLGYALSRGLVRDVRRLTLAADSFAEGHYDTRAEVASRGELRRLAEALNDMAARIAERKAVLTELASTDALTGLRNRRAFELDLDRAVDSARREHAQMAVILLDLDHFKSVNDRHGHVAGDAVLRHVAAVLCQELRAADAAARLGGEEFGVVLPATSLDAAVRVAERLRAALARTPATFAGEVIAVTASFGVVAHPAHGRTAGGLIQRADDALYQAKRTGRDRIHVPTRT